ncbi:hypothetical protein BGZ61DRAFT_541011 [Ilyonectria robusta]|uniref:uncharacterized protein n=1 Tax=Ilyonectria robusta TaxID=1079257 RepID=UPI001E8E58B3|nr:uncharacterized protein BGZ61DRAFT_541011 [Ilyonectria robusta]KAH8656332.1 hypothetical protein BGZ61DRAFT_541011 [Ilyonectria robusta]
MVQFRPETGGLGSETLPATVDFAKSHESPVEGSFWASAFLHGSDNHDYLVLSHVMAPLPFWPKEKTVYRASILDITDPSRYKMFEFFAHDPKAFASSGSLDAQYADYGFRATNPKDPLSDIRTWSSVPGAEFDLTFSLSSPAILNGGLGHFQGFTGPLPNAPPGPVPAVNQWSMPAGKVVSGHIVIDGAKVTVDADKSLTWYDRQWGVAPFDWTWFQLHLNSGTTDIPMSVWWWKAKDGVKGFATIREDGGIQKVVPIVSLEPSNRTYTSKLSGNVYPLDWTLVMVDGTKLELSSVREDQELVSPEGEFPAYGGYIEVKGIYGGRQPVTGYGVVEVVPPGSF